MATDKMKGKIKQAAGDLTDNERLEKEGELEEAYGETRQKADEVEDAAKDRWEDAKDKL